MLRYIIVRFARQIESAAEKNTWIEKLVSSVVQIVKTQLGGRGFGLFGKHLGSPSQHHTIDINVRFLRLDAELGNVQFVRQGHLIEFVGLGFVTYKKQI